MGIKLFIKLDGSGSDDSFFSGEILSGKVCIETDRDLKIDVISLELKGQGQVLWSETKPISNGQIGGVRGVRVEPEKPNETNINYHDEIFYNTSEEEYFTFKVNLAGNEGDNRSTLEIGSHEFPFSFSLPQNLPSSFLGKYGQVLYKALAILQSGSICKKSTKIFTLNGILDLNKIPENIRSPFESMKNKTMCCLCCKSGPLTLVVKVPQLGYVPGQAIIFFADVINHSRRGAKTTTVVLIQNCDFLADNYKSKDKRICLSKEIKRQSQDVKIPPGESEIWNCRDFVVPSVPPTNLAGSKIINVSYILKFLVEIDGIASSLSIETPVKIGTIPLLSSFKDLQKARDDRELPVEESGPQANCFQLYPDLPPIRFERGIPCEKLKEIRFPQVIPPLDGPSVDKYKKIAGERKNLDDAEYTPVYIVYG